MGWSLRDEDLRIQIAELVADYGLDRVLATLLHRVSNVAMGCDRYHSEECEHCHLVQSVGLAWAGVQQCPEKLLQASPRTIQDEPGDMESNLVTDLVTEVSDS